MKLPPGCHDGQAYTYALFKWKANECRKWLEEDEAKYWDKRADNLSDEYREYYKQSRKI